ncbi:MAG: radical SAM protein [Candidatus Schekmanbacteria bacterium]|nr:radical SAM protein [Candidatus Schekmanbacteria bacterium]
MGRYRELDFGVFLEGEETFPELLSNFETPGNVKGVYYRDGTDIKFTGRRELPDFEREKHPRRDLLPPSNYRDPYSLGVLAKRGCSLKCIYCNYSFLNGLRIRERPPQDIVDELENLSANYGVKTFMFADAIFNLPKKHAVEICNEIIRRKLEMKWGAYFTEIGFDDEFAGLLKKSGCDLVFFSPDGNSEKSLKLLKKPIDVSEIKRTFKLASRNKDINFIFCFFFNPPGQDLISFIKLFLLSVWYNYIARGNINVPLNNPRLEPHTDIYRMAIEEGVSLTEDELLPKRDEELSKLFYVNPSLKIANTIMLNFSRIIKGVKRVLRGGGS